MGEQGNKQVASVEGDADLVLAYELAMTVKQDKMRHVLVKSTSLALENQAKFRALDEAAQLLSYWRTMPEHITGGIAIRQLETVLSGGRAPRSASAPKP